MNDQTNKPEYNEPWFAGPTGKGWTPIYSEGERGSLSVANFYGSDYSSADDARHIERVCKLINLFAGVPDKRLDELADMSNGHIMALIRAVLLNPLETVPLCMLIDELQNTPEYQAQTGCYISWKGLYDKLLSIAELLEEGIKKSIPDHVLRYGSRAKTLSEDIRIFLAPISYMTQSRA